MVREADVLDLLESIHSAALDGTGWPAALTSLADLLDGVDTTLEVHRSVGAPPLFFAAGNRLPQTGVEDYLEHYAKICPRIPYLAGLAGGDVGCDYAFMSESQMDRDEFYADFLGAEDLRYFAAGVLSNRPNRLGGVYVHRSSGQGHIDEQGLALLKRLVPHLAAALDLHLRLQRQGERESAFRALIDRLPQAIVALDGRGELQFANAAAAALLRAEDGIALQDGRLSLADAVADKHLSALIGTVLRDSLDAGSAAGGQVIAARPSGQAAYVLAAHRLIRARDLYDDPATPAIAVFIYDPAMAARQRAATLAAAFSLTRREAALAVALLEGRSLRAQASARDVKISTERSHLKALMQKTGTHSQADLVRLLAGFFASLP